MEYTCARAILICPQVISIILDPYYRNKTEIFKSEEYHAGVILMRIPTNLFGLPKKHKFNVRKLFRCRDKKLLLTHKHKLTQNRGTGENMLLKLMVERENPRI